ncbi:MAG: saccharopine dehydrogenase [Shimia sp.]
MIHLWHRAEQRPEEARTGLTPDGVRAMRDAGHRVTVEESPARIIPIDAYRDAGAEIAPRDSWPDAPGDAIIFGLKELDPDGPDLTHHHIMFGHAYKGQTDGPALLQRFKRGGGTLLDLEYLTGEDGRRVAAFGHWAGYAGAALGAMTFAAQATGILGSVERYPDRGALLGELRDRLDGERPSILIIGAKGRVGGGAAALCDALGLPTTLWDMAETAHGGPFPEVLAHDIFVNCILAGPGVPIFVPADAVTRDRALRVVADVSCDPTSDYNPVPIYDRATSFSDPVIRVADTPPLDVMAIDNLPSLLPLESSEDYAAQLLPHLLTLPDGDVWTRAADTFAEHVAHV